MEKKNPVALIILDGWGFRDAMEGNAAALGRTPNFDLWTKKYERSILKASGEAVGLAPDQMGNSEVGHLVIGAGRIIYQDIARINRSIETGEFYKLGVILKEFEYVKRSHKKLHLFGLFGPGGVHSHSDHLYALIDLCNRHGVTPIIHLMTDGRDTPPNSGIDFVRELETYLQSHEAQIASVSGRYYAMDRDKRWDRTQLAYNAYVNQEGLKANSASEAVLNSYQQNVGDEFIKPTLIIDSKGRDLSVTDGDCLLFYNFRADRMRQIVKSFVLPDFSGFDRDHFMPNLHVLTFTEYESDLPVNVIFPKENVDQPLAQVLSEKGLRQFHTAETEKYSHVTFFLNGGREEPFEGEERQLVPSPKVATYDLKPEMSAFELTEVVLKRLEQAVDDFIVVNFANLDMVGHTGVLEAGIKAAEAVDECVGKVVQSVLARNGTVLITADHGNAEMMYDRIRNEPHTYHTTNPVRLFVIGQKYYRLRPQGGLQDVAPTILDLMDIEKPKLMTGRSLIEDSVG